MPQGGNTGLVGAQSPRSKREVLVNLSRAVLLQAQTLRPDLQVISLTAPPEVLAARLSGRGREAEDEQKRRLSRGSLPLPEGLDTRQAMAVGTAGFTAMLSVMALEDHGLVPGNGPVLVTGAAGGVGSVAVAILAALGHEVAGVTGRPDTADYLKSLGATQIVAREELNETVKRPLESETWAGCIDAVGGEMLARVLGQMKYGGSVAAVGLAGGAGLPATVIPFLLRGVNLLGIDSVMQPYDNRLRAWQRIGKDLPLSKLEDMVVPATLSDLPKLGADILNGQVRGRVVVDVNG